MPKMIKVAEKNAISDGAIKEFTVEGKQIAVANTQGEYLAFDAHCTHANCSLTGSFVDGHTVTCYCHGAQFDMKSGEVLGPPANIPLKTYKIKIDGDSVFIEM